MFKHIHKILATTILSVILISCRPDNASSQDGNNDGIQDIRVKVAEPTKTTTKVEQFPLPNCGGSDKLTQSLGSLVSVNKSATVGAKATTTGGGEIAIPETTKLKLEIQVELAYQQTFESAISRIDTIEMTAAAETHVVYTIVWEEQTFDSVVQYSSDGKVYEVPYIYKLSVPKIDKSYNVICDDSNQGNVVTSTPFQQTQDHSNSRCELIEQNLPQSAEGIANNFGISVNSVFDVLHENCGSDIIDGFVYRSNQEVELTVPNGGCIDAPPNAYFSDSTISNGAGGARAFSGIVRASNMTYRMFCYK